MNRLAAELPEQTEPTGTTAEPFRDGTVPEDGFGSGSTRREALSLGPEIEAWAQREAPGSFAGVWVDQALGGYAVAFASETERNADEVREQVHPGLAVAEANHSLAELREIQDRVTQDEMGPSTRQPGEIRSVGLHVTINRTTLGVFDPDETRLDELSATYGASAICFEIEAPPSPPSEAVETLAKASGWREGLTGETAFAVLEVAYDRGAAEVAWRDNVPADLARRDDGLPAEPGVYGSLDEVDFERQVVVVWSSGESGGCPEWVTAIGTDDGIVRVELGATAQQCPSDYNPYRLLLAVDRDSLPGPDALPASRLEGVPDGKVLAHPTDERSSAAGDPELAPRCEGLADVPLDPPADQQPTPDGMLTTAEPIDDLDGVEEDHDPADTGAALEQARRWAEREAGDAFAGMWLAPAHGTVVFAFTDDLDTYAAGLRERFGDGLWVTRLPRGQAELLAVQADIEAHEMPPTWEGDGPATGAVIGVGHREPLNRVLVSVYELDEQRLAELSQRYGADRICVEDGHPMQPLPGRSGDG